MRISVYVAPTTEPVLLSEVKTQLSQDSGTLVDNTTLYTSTPNTSHPVVTAYTLLGTGIDVLGKSSIVYLTPTNNGTEATVDCKIQEADVLAGPYNDWTGGAFTQVTESNDTVVQEKQYTGSKQYIRTASKTLAAACEFGTSIMVWNAVTTEDDMMTEDITTARLEVENDLSRKIISQTIDYYPQSWPDDDRIKLPFGNLQSLISLTIVDSSCIESDGTYALIFTGTNATSATGTYTIVSNVITAVTLTFGGTGYITTPTVVTQGGDGSITASMVSVKWKDTDGTETTLTVGTDYLVETNGEQCGFIVLPYSGSWPTSTLYPSNPITIRFICGWTNAAAVPKNIKRAIKNRAVNLYMNRGDDITGNIQVTIDKTYTRLVGNASRLFDMDFL